MSKWFIAKQYFNYLLKAKNLHGVHSPFVYAFNENILNDTRTFYAFIGIEQLRKQLLANKNIVRITDFGAGSLHTKSNERTIASITKHAAKTAKHGALLYKIIDAYNCKNILELGTSMGIGTSYMASANASASLTTIEGCPNIAHIAERNFAILNLKNITQVVGDFDTTLKKTLANNAPFDFVFVDGNHKYEPTINYFEQLINKVAQRAIIIFDDIHWSEEMHKAWQQIVADKRIPLTIDVFQFGICFIDNIFKDKEHFILKY